MCLDADPDAIREWKIASSRRDAQLAGKPFDEAAIIRAFNEQIMPFVEIYERPLLARADLVLKKSATHAIQKFDRSLVEKLRAYGEREIATRAAAGDKSGRLPLAAVEAAVSSLGLRSASRWIWELLARRGVKLRKFARRGVKTPREALSCAHVSRQCVCVSLSADQPIK